MAFGLVTNGSHRNPTHARDLWVHVYHRKIFPVARYRVRFALLQRRPLVCRAPGPQPNAVGHIVNVTRSRHDVVRGMDTVRIIFNAGVCPLNSDALRESGGIHVDHMHDRGHHNDRNGHAAVDVCGEGVGHDFLHCLHRASGCRVKMDLWGSVWGCVGLCGVVWGCVGLCGVVWGCAGL